MTLLKYDEKVSRESIPVCNIMGVNVAAINMQWLIGYLEKNLNALRGEYICVSNVHTIVTAFENEQYREVQNGGIMAIPDGGPLSYVGKHRGYGDMQRTTGPDLMGELFQLSSEKGYRHYFYGSTEKTLELLYEKLMEKYPGISIVGMYSPPFRPLSQKENELIVNNINEVCPDFIWVGLGAPKQEIWMSEHQGQFQGLMIGVGAGFDYYAGNIKRAPEWMQKTNLEWLYRLIQEPRRLFGRYLYTNFKFILNACLRGK